MAKSRPREVRGVGRRGLRKGWGGGSRGEESVGGRGTCVGGKETERYEGMLVGKERSWEGKRRGKWETKGGVKVSAG